MKSTWINCNDRMPPVGVRVLVWRPDWNTCATVEWHGRYWDSAELEIPQEREYASHWQPIEGPEAGDPKPTEEAEFSPLPLVPIKTVSVKFRNVGSLPPYDGAPDGR